MLQVEVFIDTVDAAFALAKFETKDFRSKHPIAGSAITLHEKVRQLGSTLEAYDGAFLSICAQYEFAIRSLIETYITELNAKLPLFSDLPEKIRNWYPLGCSNIMLNINQDKYQTFTQESILRSLASCVNCSLKKPYHLIPEAFSYHDSNLRSETINAIFQERLGIEKIWKKLGRQKVLATKLGSPNPLTTEQRARQKLDGTILQRNNIIHRGKAFYHPGDSEVRETARFLSILIESLEEIMDKNLAAI